MGRVHGLRESPTLTAAVSPPAGFSSTALALDVNWAPRPSHVPNCGDGDPSLSGSSWRQSRWPSWGLETWRLGNPGLAINSRQERTQGLGLWGTAAGPCRLTPPADLSPSHLRGHGHGPALPFGFCSCAVPAGLRGSLSALLRGATWWVQGALDSGLQTQANCVQGLYSLDCA